MTVNDTEASATRRPTVFLSYASEDRRAAQLIRDTLPGFGMEVWYDESDLVGGDAWDQKIRRQIRECDYFMPVISAHTEARHEGYFRREWRLAVERTLDMADDHVFLLPVVIDKTPDAGARVPEKFRAVQWLRLPDGQSTAALEALCRRLVSGEAAKPPAPPAPRSPETAGRPTPRRSHGEIPPFPREEPGQKVRFWFQVAGWGLQSGWAAFSRLPRWVRIVAYIWIGILLVSRCTSSHDDHETPPVSAAQKEKLREISGTHVGNWTPADTAQLISQIAKEVPAAATVMASTYAPVLAIPFGAPAGDAAAQKLAGSVFTQVYGRLAIVRHGHVALADQPLPNLETSAALAQGHAHGSTYIVYGAVAGGAGDQQLTVKIIATDGGSPSWSKSYPLAGADPAAIAAEVSAHVPQQSDDDD
ncbi:MAG TPA: toll/interleukin-1 receptor domain-containing protein [Steroidobacteraceae bacterium]|nr:toll/interleukin-1 receptor domain-containing protein [Steroidobacteraceae bacterium]